MLAMTSIHVVTAANFHRWGQLKKKLTIEEIQTVKEAVRQRDNCKCILCGVQSRIVHEIEPKSHSEKRSRRIFRKGNMAVVCPMHHYEIHFSTGIAKQQFNTQIKAAIRRRNEK